MRAVIQRVRSATVDVGGERVASIGAGLSPDEFKAVASPYTFIEYAVRLQRGFVEGKGLSVEDRKILMSTAQDFREGSDMLRKKWWPGYGR